MLPRVKPRPVETSACQSQPLKTVLGLDFTGTSMQRDKMILFFAGTWQPTVESAMLSTKQPAAPAFFILYFVCLRFWDRNCIL